MAEITSFFEKIATNKDASWGAVGASIISTVGGAAATRAFESGVRSGTRHVQNVNTLSTIRRLRSTMQSRFPNWDPNQLNTAISVVVNSMPICAGEGRLSILESFVKSIMDYGSPSANIIRDMVTTDNTIGKSLGVIGSSK